ncbi:trimeric intracellular cation channel family protein [Catenovulum sp. SM1970]|uniref:trimeric intracellular cation channel family protein n=1 Tax=Marinifaba aquimaris TaxID=2741323 RepID=UPI0015722849|nr:trimeric intracellular cation channel family protein [Marinifaba aquimaris]NTS77729.1 trimeric intracellular cation channel family protein [Marinifaba aquimaris]
MQYALYWFDLIGIAVFAISGTLMAYQRKMDGFGVIVLASVTAIGGGTIRDLLLDVPVFWLHDSAYIWAILLAAIMTIIWLNTHRQFPKLALEIADALGLALFVVMGTKKALSLGVPDTTAIIMGTITGCFGGMLRDVLARQVPMILKKELYAICCILGACIYTFCINLALSQQLSLILGFITVLSMRLAALKWHWGLQVFKYR